MHGYLKDAVQTDEQICVMRTKQQCHLSVLTGQLVVFLALSIVLCIVLSTRNSTKSSSSIKKLFYLNSSILHEPLIVIFICKYSVFHFKLFEMAFRDRGKVRE